MTIENAWQRLSEHAEEMKSLHLKELLKDEARIHSLKHRHDHLLLDFSKQRILPETFKQLTELAEVSELTRQIERLFEGDIVNQSEQRPALHTALRAPKSTQIEYQGRNVIDEVYESLERMKEIVTQIHAGQWRGFSGEPITTIVNIGVGGSDLGPMMACKALAEFKATTEQKLEFIFVSSMDGSQLAEVLDHLNPANTLFILASKSFTTIDTLANGATAREWLCNASGLDDALLMKRHFIGVTAVPDKANEWGIPCENQLHFAQWVGGRYSLWSAIGLPIALKIGMEGFRQLLDGAHSMDKHFRNTPFERNLPVLLALTEIWNINFLDIHAHAILPYDGRLAHLPAYLEQLEMESNGKSVTQSGEPVTRRTCPVLWGEVGPNAQHAFYQLLHQGTERVMCDFILPARRYDEHSDELKKQHRLALANCLAQSRTLALGDDVIKQAETAPAHKRYPGNQPSTTFLLDELNPYNFGALIALYEHKVYTQAVIWNINPFDQWGVELGKVMANELLESIENQETGNFDGATNALLTEIHALNQFCQYKDQDKAS
ncbi:glucose-6-phosphate isomerase [Nitrincola tibetensis]|uniref:Glucose-6-phosphate isomerase n=1 Tax=Nitrincola tibetensis TaxID=2219697 RepID=A0A364NS67_9GAMM|nr:glucose-6-phosphate isomerase [Nitrincola tibetensis]RAU19717.1 glucose-6-phosphate isomerase [Nitrincola tibetensis]